MGDLLVFVQDVMNSFSFMTESEERIEESPWDDDEKKKALVKKEDSQEVAKSEESGMKIDISINFDAFRFYLENKYKEGK